MVDVSLEVSLDAGPEGWFGGGLIHPDMIVPAARVGSRIEVVTIKDGWRDIRNIFVRDSNTRRAALEYPFFTVVRLGDRPHREGDQCPDYKIDEEE
jgi:hypothetical protein